MTQQTGNVDQKETREIYTRTVGQYGVMAMETFVLLVVTDDWAK